MKGKLRRRHRLLRNAESTSSPTLRSPALLSSLLCLVLAASASPAAAAAGDLDPKFGGNGKVTTGFGLWGTGANAVAIQSDGKIVVAGTAALNDQSRFALARYDRGGTLDPSFGGNGKVKVRFPENAGATGVAIQADDKIVVAGGAGGQFAVARLNTDGSLDPAFSEDGKVRTDVNNPESPFGAAAADLAIQADGKIVVAGTRRDEDEAESDNDVVLLRYNDDGTLDSTFGTNGAVITNGGPRGGIRTSALAVVVKPNGKIVVAGAADLGFMLLRFNPDGALDPSFGRQGAVLTSFDTEGSSGVAALALQDDGKLVAAGHACSSYICAHTSRFALARYKTDGTLDPSFGGDGRRTTRFGPESVADATAVAIQDDGNIVAAGQSWECPSSSACFTNQRFALARYKTDGSLDASFGENGKLTTRFGRDSLAEAAALALQDNSKIVAAGGATTSSERFALARYLH